MFNFLSDSTSPKRFGSTMALAVILCLGGLSSQAQTAPAAKVKPDHYYLNGKPSTKEAVESLDPKTIDRMDVLSGQQAIDYTHDATSKGVVLVQTK